MVETSYNSACCCTVLSSQASGAAPSTQDLSARLAALSQKRRAIDLRSLIRRRLPWANDPTEALESILNVKVVKNAKELLLFLIFTKI